MKRISRIAMIVAAAVTVAACVGKKNASEASQAAPAAASQAVKAPGAPSEPLFVYYGVFKFVQFCHGLNLPPFDNK